MKVTYYAIKFGNGAYWKEASETKPLLLTIKRERDDHLSDFRRYLSSRQAEPVDVEVELP